MDIRSASANKTGRTYPDSQGVAHFLERERSVSRVVKNPQLSFSEFLPAVGMMYFEITLKTSHRIDQDREHWTHDRLDRSRAAQGRNCVGITASARNDSSSPAGSIRSIRVPGPSMTHPPSRFAVEGQSPHGGTSFCGGRGTESRAPTVWAISCRAIRVSNPSLVQA
jgi:hypothetical protein